MGSNPITRSADSKSPSVVKPLGVAAGTKEGFLCPHWVLLHEAEHFTPLDLHQQSFVSDRKPGGVSPEQSFTTAVVCLASCAGYSGREFTLPESDPRSDTS
ncbi:MAG: hypothetical protein OEV76_00795 [Anaerolineae bacterium]|nr:hypothetical protein [Anaerolineae bacterium]